MSLVFFITWINGFSGWNIKIKNNFIYHLEFLQKYLKKFSFFVFIRSMSCIVVPANRSGLGCSLFRTWIPYVERKTLVVHIKLFNGQNERVTHYITTRRHIHENRKNLWNFFILHFFLFENKIFSLNLVNSFPKNTEHILWMTGDVYSFTYIFRWRYFRLRKKKCNKRKFTATICILKSSVCW